MKMKRREVLQTASLALSGLGLAAAQAHGAEQTEEASKTADAPPPLRDSGESKAFAQFVADTRFEHLPAATVTMTKRSILDAIGVSLGASGLEPVCRPFVDQAVAVAGKAESSIFGFEAKAPAELAALANGAMAHALDYEDAHEASRTHPNAASIPAALAIAEAHGGVDGREFISAIAVGCDIACRLILAGDPADEGGRRDGFYPPPIVGAFSATAAAAKLLGLNATQVLDAFSLTLCRCSFSAEVIDSPLSHMRAVRESFAAQTAVSSVYLAQRGVKGFDRPFEGRSGYYNMFGNGVFDAEKLAGHLGQSFYGETISFKAWPSCRASHAYIQAVQELQRRASVRIEDIDSIFVTISPLDEMLVEPAANRKTPQTAIDAKFSLPFTVATALLQGNVTLESFSPEALQNAAVLALAAKVVYRIDAERARVTSKGGGDLIEVTTKNGARYKQGIAHLYGSPDYPMSEQALVQKFLGCAALAARPASQSRLRSVADRLLALEKEQDVGDIMTALT